MAKGKTQKHLKKRQRSQSLKKTKTQTIKRTNERRRMKKN